MRRFKEEDVSVWRCLWSHNNRTCCITVVLCESCSTKCTHSFIRAVLELDIREKVSEYTLLIKQLASECAFCLHSYLMIMHRQVSCKVKADYGDRLEPVIGWLCLFLLKSKNAEESSPTADISHFYRVAYSTLSYIDTSFYLHHQASQRNCDAFYCDWLLIVWRSNSLRGRRSLCLLRVTRRQPVEHLMIFISAAWFCASLSQSPRGRAM